MFLTKFFEFGFLLKRNHLSWRYFADVVVIGVHLWICPQKIRLRCWGARRVSFNARHDGKGLSNCFGSQQRRMGKGAVSNPLWDMPRRGVPKMLGLEKATCCWRCVGIHLFIPDIWVGFSGHGSQFLSHEWLHGFRPKRFSYWSQQLPHV